MPGKIAGTQFKQRLEKYGPLFFPSRSFKLIKLYNDRKKQRLPQGLQTSMGVQW